MPFAPFLPRHDVLPVATINHLLTAESWAREKLRPFSGEIARFVLLPLPDLLLRVTAEGLVETVEPALSDTASLTIKLSLAALPAFLQGGTAANGAMKHVEISGRVDFASAVQSVALHLRWDIEEDLSGIVGDIAAVRMVQAGRDLIGWQRQAGGVLRRILPNTGWKKRRCW